ncbi:MAG: HU family DNA-binding protein [Candidatus Omnitrophota bacterium]
MNTITKKDLVKKISYSTGERQQVVKRIIEETLEHITEAMTRGERVELRKFGVFKISWREAKIARNPKTGEKISISSRKVVKFKSGKFLFKRLNEK